MPSSSDPGSDSKAKILKFFTENYGKSVPSGQEDKIKEKLWDLKKEGDRQQAERLRRPPSFTEILRAVTDDIFGPKPESPIENEMLLGLNTRSICCGRVQPQFEVGPYRIDLALSDAKLAIECDGKDFHSTPAQVAHDQKRSAFLTLCGWTVLRFTGSQIHRSIGACVDRVCLVYDDLLHAKKLKESWE